MNEITLPEPVIFLCVMATVSIIAGLFDLRLRHFADAAAEAAIGAACALLAAALWGYEDWFYPAIALAAAGLGWKMVDLLRRIRGQWLKEPAE